MALEVAAFPTVEQPLGQRVDAAALWDRVASFVRSWTADDAPFTMARVLDLWRLAERDLDATTPGSEGWIDASQRFIAARSEYRRLFDLAAVNADFLRRVW